MRSRSTLALVAFLGLLWGCPSGQDPGLPNPDDGGDMGEPGNDGGDGGNDGTDGGSDGSGLFPGGETDLAPFAVQPKMTATPPAPTPGATTLLNEVRFDPIAGDFQFVELKVGAGGAPLSQLLLVNENNDVFDLPDGITQLAAGSTLLIVFDGAGTIEPGIVHANRNTFLHPVSGSLDLRDDTGNPLDRVAWGLDRSDGVGYGDGGVPTEPLAGMVIARLPSATDVDLEDWVAFAGVNATPGGPNHNVGMGVLFPTNGAWLGSGSVELSWYPVPQAVQYQVQLSMSASFDVLLLDETVTSTPVTADAFAQGTYYWHVRPLFADGSTGDFSVTQHFTVDDTALTGDGTSIAAATADKQDRTMKVVAGVPSIAQRKDTALILLESYKTAQGHAWDQAHSGADKDDKADNRNCSLASVAMINHKYGGTLSQDRIGYQMRTEPYRHDIPGPEMDLNWGVGILPQPALVWALGLNAGDVSRTNFLRHDAANFDRFWTDLTAEIDAGRPVILVKWVYPNTHTMVGVGYEVVQGVRRVVIHNPWNEGHTGAKVERCTVNEIPMSYYCRIIGTAAARIAARKDEASITTDTDKDGIMDFDETMRFGTDPMDRDSDDDCIEDKNEIRNSMLHGAHGWAMYQNKMGGDGMARRRALTTNAAGVPTAGRPELDMDSDGGGLLDSMEDTDFDGNYEPGNGESDPYDSRDDSRKITGYLEVGQDTIDSQGSLKIVEKGRYDFNLQLQNGEMKGTATYSYSNVNTYHHDHDCEGKPNPYDVVLTVMQDPNPVTINVKGRFANCQTLEIESDPVTQVTRYTHRSDPCADPPESDGAPVQNTPLQRFGPHPPSSVEGGKVIYFSTSTVQLPPRIGFAKTERNITVQK